MRFANEQAFTDAIIELAMMSRWLVLHMRGKTKSLIQGHTGFPDLVLVRGARVLYRELKMLGENPEPDQSRWAAALLAGGADWKLWRPADWDEIVETLTGRKP